MVHVSTPRPSIGAAIGQALGAVGGEQFAYQRNRGRLQDALNQVEQSAKPGATPLQTTLSFLNAMAGVPGSERYVGQVLPLVLQQANSQNVYGQGQDQMAPGGGGSPPPGPAGQPNVPQPRQSFNPPPQSQAALQPNQSADQVGPVSPQGTPQEVTYPTGGVLPQIMPVDQMDAEAKRAALVTGNPQMYQQRMSELTQRNQLAEQANNQARARLQSIGVKDNELDEAMKIGQKYGYMTNPDQWLNATKQDWRLYKNNKEKLLGIATPGFFRGLISGPKGREHALKRMDNVVKDMLNQGFEPETRLLLDGMGLSPTEVEERINPISKKTQAELDGFQSGVKSLNVPSAVLPTGLSLLNRGLNLQAPLNEGQRSNLDKKLVKFFEGNLDRGGSLASMRHTLAIDKNVPWEMIGPAIRQAAENREIPLTQDQQREMVEIETQPPRESLSEIFTDWFRPIEYIKGAK